MKPANLIAGFIVLASRAFILLYSIDQHYSITNLQNHLPLFIPCKPIHQPKIEKKICDTEKLHIYLQPISFINKPITK